MARFALLALAALLLAACSDGAAPPAPQTALPSVDNGTTGPPITPVTPVARPAGVPAGALVVDRTTRLGRIVRSANEAPQPVMTRELLDAHCRDDLITFETSDETIYAALGCESFWDEQAVALFTGQQAAVLLEATETRYRIFIETLEGAQAEFTVGGIWIE